MRFEGARESVAVESKIPGNACEVAQVAAVSKLNEHNTPARVGLAPNYAAILAFPRAVSMPHEEIESDGGHFDISQKYLQLNDLAR